MKTVAPEQVGLSASRLARIATRMRHYVDQKKLAGIVTLVARRGGVAHFEKFGYQDLSSGTPIELDTIFRIYSMTKPVTSVALMMLFERGLVRLSDPVSKFVPEFKQVKVYVGAGELADLEREITVHDLLTHTAGLSYDFFFDSPVDALYREADLRADITLEEMVRRIASLPLVHQPGRVWRYSMAVDVIGRVIEVISGLSLAEFFDEKILRPLGMRDTAFAVPPEAVDRFATMYGLTEKGALDVLETPAASNYTKTVRRFSGGGGLVSTAADFVRFAQLVLNKGELDGVRLLGRKTMEYMTINHLPPALLPIKMEEPMPGTGFGLGFSVLMDVAQSDLMGSAGAHGWGGAANTHFWVDPQEQLIGILMLQYMPSHTYPVTSDFRTLVYQALVD